MQIPMQALGVTHAITNLFKLKGTKLVTNMSQGDLDRVKVLKADESTPMFEPHKIKWKKSRAYNTLNVGLKRRKISGVSATINGP